MKEIRKAVYAASLDPITNGHLNVISRISELYDEIIVIVAVDKRKKYTFTPEERVEMAKAAVTHLQNVHVVVCIGRYVVKVAEELGANVIVRGLRNSRDLEEELVLAEENRKINPNVETVWIPCLPELAHVSSSMVKGHVGVDPCWQQQVARSVPPGVVYKLKYNYQNALERAKKHWDSLMAILGNPDISEEIFSHIVENYSEPNRAYHILEHIVEMLDELEVAQDYIELENLTALKMGIWYHDFIYHTQSEDAMNVARSAYGAEIDLIKLGLSVEFIDKVKSFITPTVHKETVTNTEAQLIVDLDLTIFGKSTLEFNAYEAKIRKEYDWVEQSTFNSARAQILRSFLELPAIYYTSYFREKYENAARDNLTKSVAKLECE